MLLIKKIFTGLCLGACLILLAFIPLRGLQIELAKPSSPASGESDLDQLISQIRFAADQYAGGIYAPGTFAFPIVEQPENNALYVSAKRNLVTLFSAAEDNGIMGLLAHNFLAGASFYNLEVGQQIWLITSEQKQQGYRVTDIEHFQKIEEDETETFVDLKTQETMSSGEVFSRFYTGEPHLTLQTCLEKDGDLSWGLTFIVAEPIQ